MERARPVPEPFISPTRTARPNVLLVTADQLRWDALGSHGGPAGVSPHLDALAAGGLDFRHAHTPCPSCVPARMAMITGRFPRRLAATQPEGHPPLPRFMADAGYATGAFGKMHFHPYTWPRNVHGFEHSELHEEGRILHIERDTGRPLGGENYAAFLEEAGFGGYQRAHGIGNNDVHLGVSPLPAELYESSWVVDRCMRWLEGRRAAPDRKPFFAWVSFTRPHPPFDPPHPWNEKFDPRSLPPPLGPVDLLESKAPAALRLRKLYGWDKLSSPQHAQLARAHYFGLVAFLDAQLGRLFAWLKAAGLWDSTFVVFTSDHGEMLGDFGLFFKGLHWQGSSRIPLIVKPLDGRTGTREDLAGLEDLFPTVAHAAGLDIPRGVTGLPLIEEGGGAPRGDYFAAIRNRCLGMTRMLRAGRWKYIESQGGGARELYDLESDPGECRNLAAEKPHESDALAGRLRERTIQASLEGADADGRFPSLPISEPDRDPFSVQGIRWH